MKKKEIVDFISSLSLMILACVVLLLPTFNIDNIKLVLTIIFGFYTLIKLSSFILIIKERDYESLFTGAISLVGLIAIYYIELSTKNLALILMIWLGISSLIKLKKADFYHDRDNKMWILRLFILFVFLTTGLIFSLNLMYENSVQILIIGCFFLINSLLDAVDPLVTYLMRSSSNASN